MDKDEVALEDLAGEMEKQLLELGAGESEEEQSDDSQDESTTAVKPVQEIDERADRAEFEALMMEGMLCVFYSIPILS